MIYTLNRLGPKGLYLHTYDEHGIKAILYPPKHSRNAAKSTWIQIRVPLNGKSLDWTIQQRLNISNRNVTVRTTSRMVKFLGGEVKLTERVTVEEGPA